MPSMRIERVFSVFWFEAVMAREMSCDIEKEGGMTGVAVLVATVAIILDLGFLIEGVEVERIE